MRRTIVRAAAVTGAVVPLLLGQAAVASAHTDVEATASQAGRTRITLTPEQECGEGALPTTGLRIQLPPGAGDVSAAPDGGWIAQVTATEVAWTSPSGADEPSFTVEMVLAEPAGSTVYLPAIQTCPDGEEIAWIQTPSTPGDVLQRPAPSFEVPANTTAPTAPATTTTAPPPSVTTTATAAAAAVDTDTSDDDTPVLLVVALAAAVVLGGGAVWLVLRRRASA